jgi:predicted anti-sigma-YlaC factor YlaD
LFDICERVAESLSAYLDDEDADEPKLDQASIEAHLRVCTYCGALRPAGQARPRSGQVPAPPARLWETIEATLRSEGLIRD